MNSEIIMTNRIIYLVCVLAGVMFAAGCYIEEPDYKPINPNIYTNNQNKNNYQSNNYQKSGGRYSLNGKTVIVDAGHGGKDPGAQANGVREKDVNLEIARKLASRLQQYGVRAVMTRNSDVFIELDDRAAAAEQYKADILVSIHADSISNTSTSGATVLTGIRASQNSKLAARLIQSALSEAGIQYRPTRSQQLRVCDGHSRPAVLVETGFLTNYQEAQNLSNSWYQDKLADAIAKGVADYLSR